MPKSLRFNSSSICYWIWIVFLALWRSLARSKNLALFYLLSSRYIKVLWVEPMRLLSLSISFKSFSFDPSALSISSDFSLEYKASLDTTALLVIPVFEVWALVEFFLVLLYD
jgi:hypothetical protein